MLNVYLANLNLFSELSNSAINGEIKQENRWNRIKEKQAANPLAPGDNQFSIDPEDISEQFSKLYTSEGHFD